MTLSEQGEKNLRSPLLADSGNGGCNGMFCQYSTGGEAKAAEVRESERDNWEWQQQPGASLHSKSFIRITGMK
jgi:hypothetical protein